MKVPKGFYDYPTKKGGSIAEISLKLYGKRHIDLSDNQYKKVKAEFRKMKL